MKRKLTVNQGLRIINVKGEVKNLEGKIDMRHKKT